MTGARISLMIVDDHPLVRDSLSYFLGAEGGFDVLGSVATADACYEALSEGVDPDIVLMDIEMPGSSAFRVAMDLKKQGHRARFVFLTAYLTDANLGEALQLGVCGYLLKQADVKDLADAIREVAAGRSAFGPEVRKRLEGTARLVSRVSLMTAREKEVLRCVASDLSGKEIAVKLGLSVRTVDRHKANIMEKLKIHSQVGLTRFAVAEGLCDPRFSNV